MNTKKILLFAAILMMTIASLSIVSAGLFDLGNNDSSQDKYFEVSGKIIEGTYDYGITGHADTSNSPGFTTEDDFQYSMNGSGTVKVNITNATDEELDNISKTIEGYDFENDDDFYLDIVYEFNGSDSIYGANIQSISLDDTIMTVKFSDVHDIAEKTESGSADILSGELNWGNSKNGFSIFFICD